MNSTRPIVHTMGASLLGASLSIAVLAQSAPDNRDARLKELEAQVEDLKWAIGQLAKTNDDILWFQRVGDLADIDKVTYTGPPNPRGQETFGIKNERHPMKIYQYVFVPKTLDRSRQHPLLVLPHGGVHADFTTYHVHIIRELMERGYVVIAPEYRGSTGYGKAYYEAIDYGGLEVADVVAGRDWAVEQLPFVNPERCAILGWSHGGLISLMVAFDYPSKFRAAYAGVPVSDLITRLGYHDKAYTQEFVAKYHIGKTPEQDVEAYRKRSPVWNVRKLEIPLMVHTSTNDRDVNVVEVEQLINALKAEGKNFEHKIYKDAPGGHSFNRIDTALAKESRKEIYEFLEKNLR